MGTSDADDDVALVLGATENAEKLAVLRKRGEEVQAAVLSKTRDGEAIHGDLVRLKPRDDSPLMDVETLHQAPTSAPSRARPAQVASRSYRRGWGRVFAKKRKSGSKPN